MKNGQNKVFKSKEWLKEEKMDDKYFFKQLISSRRI